MSKVKSTIVADIEGAPPGAIQIEHRGRGIFFVCPCGCGAHRYVYFRGQVSDGPSWERTGPNEEMTLSPSVNLIDPNSGASHWHGYLRDGIWESC